MIGKEHGFKYFFYKNIKQEKVNDKISIEDTNDLEPHHPDVELYEMDIELNPGEE